MAKPSSELRVGIEYSIEVRTPSGQDTHRYEEVVYQGCDVFYGGWSGRTDEPIVFHRFQVENGDGLSVQDSYLKSFSEKTLWSDEHIRELDVRDTLRGTRRHLFGRGRKGK